MENAKLNKFQLYINKATAECQNLSFIEKTQGLWSEPEIIKYLTRISKDEPNEFLAASLQELLPDLNGKKILCIGGGTGKLGRNILNLYPELFVTEVDSAPAMVDCANKLADQEGFRGRFISLKADSRLLPFQDGEYNYAIALGVFRYIDPINQERSFLEISRVSNNNFTIAEPILKELIYSLKDKFRNVNYSIKETPISMFRMSLFYMLFKEYKRNKEFKTIIDSEVDDTNDFIEVLTHVAGMTNGILYELRARC
jgi:ubiquinone/menaquinone biosynthesis C-methylase UbiE